MDVITTEIADLLILKPRVFEDPRGYFYEPYNKRTLAECGITADFVQDNQSLSGANVLRGLHLQLPPHTQEKLVRVISGGVLNVAVDLRKNSPTYGKHVAIELNEDNKLMLWLPHGFANGFRTLADNTMYFYKVTEYWNKASEISIQWNDPDLAIDWGASNPIVAEKDQNGIPFREFVSPF